MLAEQVVIEANNINMLMRRRNWTRSRRERRALLGQAVEASLGALPILVEEPLIRDTERYLAASYERLGSNGEALREEMRHDALVLRMFMSAECSLLHEMGVDASTVEGIADGLVAAIRGGASEPDSQLVEKLALLINELQTDLEQIARESERSGTAARVAGALGVLGGSLVVAADAAAAVASHGIAAGAAAASISVGSSIVDTSLNEALGGG